MFKEFKQFAMRGNVLDLAVGIIIGAAFGKIVSSFVNDVLMPPIGMLIGGMDFSELTLTLREATADAPAVVLKYGVFINAIIDFLIVAFAIFMLIRAINRMSRKAPAPPPAPSEKNCPECLMTIPIAARRCGHCGVAIEQTVLAG
jgi:large conductance mechanosensitive channel